MGARSKGCNTCKSRKVRCDGTLPSCNRCRKLGHECAGCEMTFVDEKPRIERAQAIARQQQEGIRSMQMYCKSNLQTPGPSTGLSQVASKDGILLSFLVNKLHSGRSHCERLAVGSKTGPPLILPCSPRGTWIWEMAKTPHDSLGAFSAMFFGQAHNLREMMISSLRLYGRALEDCGRKSTRPYRCLILRRLRR